MAALTPFRTALVHPPATGVATITGTLARTLDPVTCAATGTHIAPVTGTLAVTLGPVTLTATGTATGTSGGSPNAVGNMVGSMNSAGGVAFGGNVVHMVTQVPRRIRRPTRIR